MRFTRRSPGVFLVLRADGTRHIPVPEPRGNSFLHDGTGIRRGRVISALRKIRVLKSWFERQAIFRYYASSILITYDSADPPLEGVDAEEDVEVRMIDFAHAVPVDVVGPDGTGPAQPPGDEGYLHGLNNVSTSGTLRRARLS